MWRGRERFDWMWADWWHHCPAWRPLLFENLVGNGQREKKECFLFYGDERDKFKEILQQVELLLRPVCVCAHARTKPTLNKTVAVKHNFAVMVFDLCCFFSCLVQVLFFKCRSHLRPSWGFITAPPACTCTCPLFFTGTNPRAGGDFQTFWANELHPLNYVIRGTWGMCNANCGTGSDMCE